MAGYWLIMTEDKEVLMEREVYSKQQEMNTLHSAKAIILLDLVQTVNKKSYQIQNVTIIIAMDEKKLQRIVYGAIVTPNNFNQDAAP